MKALSQWTGLMILFSFLVGCNPASTVNTPLPTQIPTIETTVQPTLETSLQLGNWHDMIYHEGVGQVVLVNGGPENGKNPDDPVELWGWDGEQWSLFSADSNGPSWRNFASVTYDSNRDVSVLYGGLTSEQEFLDTWEWDGKQWTQFLVEGPGPREAAGMAYDMNRQRVVLFGGAQSGKMMNDIWEWDGDIWSQVSVAGPGARFPASFVYDAANQNIVLFGGHTITNQGIRTYGDTWTWDGTVWAQITAEGPSPRDGADAVFIQDTNQIFLFGGAEIDSDVTLLNDTWLWDGAQWTQVEVEGPPARVHPAMAFDVMRGRVVMTGGSNAPGNVLADTWEWDGQVWVCIIECK